MADKTENVTDSKELDQKLGILARFGKVISRIVSGSDGTLQQELEKQSSDISQLAVDRVFNKVTSEGDFHELLTAIESNITKKSTQSKRTQSKLSKEVAPSVERGRININNLVEGVNAASINDLFFSEFERIQRYSSYDQIYEFIPQMSIVVNTYAENIISPESFSDFSLNISYTDPLDPEASKAFTEMFKKLNDKYKLESDLNEFVKNTVYLGDGFKAVLPYRLELNRLLSEDNHVLNEEDKTITLNESDFQTILSEDISSLDFTSSGVLLTEASITIDEDTQDLLVDAICLEEGESLISSASYASMSIEEKSKAIKSKVAGIAANRTEIVSQLKRYTAEKITFNKDWRLLIKNSKHDETTDFTSDELEKRFSSGDSSKIIVKQSENEEYNVSGSILLTLDPNRIVKLQSDDNHCYGYFYLEYVDSNTFGVTSSFASNASGNNYFHNMTNKRNTQIESRIRTIKNQLITDMFIKNAAESLDKKFIETNPHFREVIFSMLSNQYKADKNIAISFIPAKYVHHFGNLKRDGYGQSIFEPIFFTAKLYLASLISAIMQKLILSPEKRIFYVETGLDEDMEGAVNSFVASIKSKDFKISNFKDINTSMNTIGAFHDLYIPKTEGQRPVEVETMPSRDVSLDNDFLEYLKKAMISGSGVPPEYITNSEEVEFARTLSMRHGRFVRSIITHQKQFGKNYKGVLISLYNNEYNSKAKDIEIPSEMSAKFNPAFLEVSFPQPLTIFSNIINEQLRTTQDIGEFISKIYLGERNEDELLKADFLKQVVKDFLPTLDWDHYDKIFDEISKERKRKSISKPDDDTDDSGF